MPAYRATYTYQTLNKPFFSYPFSTRFQSGLKPAFHVCVLGYPYSVVHVVNNIATLVKQWLPFLVSV